ncbi:hypothetical protein CERZMDRAFT_104907 [Cercospora zeae-maydis SCOH1-5]|uniref:Uncharacterized protein n=1 Tax=Cercospora zeae-maydis SCOH1-5 TaxID=717836 RepID=A0A6A6FQR7_9PEZI|nr:hypothetical protein CERZMDRAFT_104907 [Cercospora zeae-maydis SCOH1-5]
MRSQPLSFPSKGCSPIRTPTNAPIGCCDSASQLFAPVVGGDPDETPLDLTNRETFSNHPLRCPSVLVRHSALKISSRKRSCALASSCLNGL